MRLIINPTTRVEILSSKTKEVIIVTTSKEGKLNVRTAFKQDL